MSAVERPVTFEQEGRVTVHGPNGESYSIPFVAYALERLLEADEMGERVAVEATALLDEHIPDVRSRLRHVLFRRVGENLARRYPHANRWAELMIKADHDVYMKSSVWDRRRRAALKAAGYRCQLCNADEPLDVHHRTYERFGFEKPSDLIALCRGCHNGFHATNRHHRQRTSS